MSSKNPFNPDIYIHFSVGDENCNVNEQHVISIRILNILAQTVAVPVFAGPDTTVKAPPPGGQTISNLKLGCGGYQMYWNGHLPSGPEAPSGVYAVQIITDGKLTDSKKIYYAK